jgi:hypothetical protein
VRKNRTKTLYFEASKLFHLSKKIWSSIGNYVNEALHAAKNVVGMHNPFHNLHFDSLKI